MGTDLLYIVIHTGYLNAVIVPIGSNNWHSKKIMCDWAKPMHFNRNTGRCLATRSNMPLLLGWWTCLLDLIKQGLPRWLRPVSLVNMNCFIVFGPLWWSTTTMRYFNHSITAISCCIHVTVGVVLRPVTLLNKAGVAEHS